MMMMMMMMMGVKAWTGEINGRVVCDVCGDGSIGPEDHVLQGQLFTFSFSFKDSLCNLLLYCIMYVYMLSLFWFVFKG